MQTIYYLPWVQPFANPSACLILLGAGYEWEDDFSLLPLPTSKMVSDSPPPPRSTPLPPGPQPAAKFSRFTVSPSSVSRFSITHVSDSDVDSAWGRTLQKSIAKSSVRVLSTTQVLAWLLLPGRKLQRGRQKYVCSKSKDKAINKVMII